MTTIFFVARNLEENNLKVQRTELFVESAKAIREKVQRTEIFCPGSLGIDYLPSCIQQNSIENLVHCTV